MITILCIILSLFLYPIPLALCIFASYRSFKKDSAGLVAILFLISFVPIANIGIGYYTFLEYLIQKLRDE